MSFGITFPGVVTRVLDGDTLEVRVERTVRIRLLDCWAPETRTKDADEKRAGQAAKRHLHKLAIDKAVAVHVPIEADARFGEAMSMGRVLGYVQLADGTDLSQEMVAAGHATKKKTAGRSPKQRGARRRPSTR